MKASRGWFVAAILAFCYGVVTMGWGLFELISGETTENVVMGVLFLASIFRRASEQGFLGVGAPA